VTIRRGEQWGEAVESPPDLALLSSDAALRRWVVRAREDNRPVPPVGLTGGDLAHSIGGGHPSRFPGVVTRACVDIVRVEAAGHTTWVVAHLVGFRAWWRGEAVLVMNAQYRGDWDVAPRSHPNDGKADIIRVDPAMPWRQRRAAAKRARTGTHLPHPQLDVRQTGQAELRFVAPLPLWADGERWTVADRATITVETDALDLYV
jgi:hypothetical protein